MFDFSQLGDVSKLAQDAKQLQKKQGVFYKEQLELLRKISSQLEELINIVKSKNSQIGNNK